MVGRILVDVTTTVVQWVNQTFVLAFIRDNTERHKIEKEERSMEGRLQRSKKMELGMNIERDMISNAE